MKIGHVAQLGLAIAFATLPAVPSPAQTLPTSGVWSIEASRAAADVVELNVRIREPGGNSNWGNDTPLSDLHGLSSSALSSSGTEVTFDVVRDAGTLHCTGHVANGNGGGTFIYEANARFPAELASRGISAPGPDDQLKMTLSDVTLSFIDALRGYHYAISSPEQLIRLTDHGVTPKFLSDLESAGYHVASTDDLARLVDHGVTSAFINAMKGLGYQPTSEDLVRMVDHGVTADFARGMISLGYHPSVEDLVRLVDHGVTLEYVKHLRARGYNATIDQLIRLRDSGV
jgi:hypothetical protein